MAIVTSIHLAPDREKNIKALAYTGVVCAVVFIIFFFATWTLPQIDQPVVEEGIEVNLGNSDEGLGEVPPMVPGPPAEEAEPDVNTPQQVAQQAPAPQQQTFDGDENEADDVPSVPARTKPAPKTTAPANKPVVTNKPTSQPVSNPTPPTPKPKALYKGGTAAGTGGNNADSYNNVRNQGIAGGRGDQGNPNGNPNSDSYKGNAASGNSGVVIRKGLNNRKFRQLPSFQDDFNENAKVAVDIVVDKSGNVTSTKIALSGTTTTNNNIKNIALRKARQLKLTAGTEDEQTGTVVFDFRIKG